MAPLTVNVIAVDYAYGLKRSRAIAADALAAAGFRVRTITTSKFLDGMRAFVESGRSRSDVNVFIERLVPQLCALARKQVLIPNQEWFFPSDEGRLAVTDLVVCKTRLAEDIFGQRKAPALFASFTSHDRQRANRTMHREFLCLGAKHQSVVRRIVPIWIRHPEWPRLTLITARDVPRVRAANVTHIRNFLSDETVLRLQNEHRFHLCVSRAEGFGHKLCEGMSCGAIVLATDGAPMNELVTPDRGMLVAHDRSEPMRLGTAFDFSESALEETVERCLRLTDEEINVMGRRARTWFEENDRFFRDRFPSMIAHLQ